MNEDRTENNGDAREPPELLIVGIGASAGGLEALEAFFDNMPSNPGMAFIVVTHLQPGRASLLPEILGRHCAMPVSEVAGGMMIEANRVYVAPPGSNVTVLNGTLHLVEQGQGASRYLPIDYFFRSLAQGCKERAVGIVLSGTGTDGTLGLAEIKGAAGMAMAQEEASAQYAGMPHSAITSRQVDYILSADEMPGQLMAYARSASRHLRGAVQETEGSEAYQRIFVLLRNRTGHDFSFYKSATVHRRIARRMDVQQLDSVRDYMRFLQTHPEEIDRLFKELLIGVTSFFRDPEAFEALARALPEMLADKPSNHVVRVWVPGCSSGEEAYSIAILLRECMEQLERHLDAQIFATDIDGEAIEIARTGLFPNSVAADLSASRLDRFFIPEDNHYRVKKDIRDMLIFAQQNVLDDPPFTKLDLLSCRNVLIYFDNSLQQRLLPIFHYALNPGGILFLGASETVGGFSHLFEAVDKKWKLFRCRAVASGGYEADVRAMPPAGAAGREGGHAAGPPKVVEDERFRLAERALLQHLVPPSALVHERGEVIHIHGRTGLFLEPAPGPQGRVNIYNMAREGLQLDLAVAIRKAGAADGAVVRHGAHCKNDGDTVAVELRVQKLTRPKALRGLYLVTFVQPADFEVRADSEAAVEVPLTKAERLDELEYELQRSREVHQSMIEELETANEELKSTNEELQSANEELETSKEEMQSLNEELQTVNTELQSKVEELSRANDDMNNLLNGTDVATIFLDASLHIQRYTKQAKRVFRLIPSDTGRSIGDLVPRLRYRHIVDDAHEVLRTLVHREVEVQSEDDVWYLMRILPYRTAENVINGVVLTFVDISKIKGIREEIRRVLAALEHSPSSVFGQDAELRYLWAGSPVFGHPARDVVGKTDRDLLPPRSAQVVSALKRRVLEGDMAVRERIRISVGKEVKSYDMYLAPLHDSVGRVSGVSGVINDIDERSG